MNVANLLRAAYITNIIILVPVVYAMIVTGGVSVVFNALVEESAGLRLLVGSLWAAILVASMFGLVWPQFFVPILVVQVFYKSLWLLLYVVPLMLRSQWSMIPTGISLTFIAIVIIYPPIIVAALRGGVFLR
ncbi:MAG: hypothetical protein ACRCWO_11460 [Bosea sp. (in: a-proteobacteria)]